MCASRDSVLCPTPAREWEQQRWSERERGGEGGVMGMGSNTPFTVLHTSPQPHTPRRHSSKCVRLVVPTGFSWFTKTPTKIPRPSKAGHTKTCHWTAPPNTHARAA